MSTELIKERIEKVNSQIVEVRECDPERCEYDMSERDHRDEEQLLVGRKAGLSEALEIINKKTDDKE